MCICFCACVGWLCVGLCVHVCVCTHTPPLLLQCALSLARSIHCGHSPKPLGLTHPAPTHPPPSFSASYLNATNWSDSSHAPSSPSCREMARLECLLSLEGASGRRWGRKRLGGPLEVERTLYSVPFRLSLTQLSYSFAVVHRCPAATAPAGVPGTPQPGHCASSGPGPHPVLTCCSWEHEEPPRPAH